ncbi:MAG TPA: hypothetical protein VGG19_12795 [Tepidisphaeraceae bacterium]
MRCVMCVILLGMVVGCTTTPADLRKSDASVQIPAMERSARRKDLTSEKQMVQNLGSDDPAIRFYAIESLYRLTGTTMGYKYYDDELERAQAIIKWEEWLKDQGENSKNETRNSKQAQNSNVSRSQTDALRASDLISLEA